MKWIKDTERLPEKYQPKCLKVRNTNEFDITCGLTVGYWEYPYWYTPFGDTIRGSVEWLDESPSGSEAWVSVETPPDNMIAVIVAGQYGNRIITCSDTAYYDKTKGRWFDYSNDMMLAEGFLKFYQPLPQPPIKSEI